MSDSLNILVVEDDEALRDALLITLETAGHRVTGADGGPAALAALATGSFSMVVSDLRMAPMDGLELLSAHGSALVEHIQNLAADHAVPRAGSSGDLT